MAGMLSSARPLVVTTIGTCRVADPIIAARKERPIKRANRRVYGFVHTSAEALQQIEYLNKQRDIPKDLAPFMAGPEKTGRDVTDDPDLFIVEISTTKQIYFGEWLLQTNRMEEALKDFDPLRKIFNRFRMAEQRRERAVELQKHPLFERASPIQQQVLLEAYVTLTTREELESHLIEIVRRLPAPVVFSCHIDVDSPDGKPLQARRELCGWMREICQSHGFAMIDPTPKVLEYGATNALAEDGNDLNHYSSSFKAHYGAYLYDLLAGSMTQADNADVAPSVETEAPQKSISYNNLEEEVGSLMSEDAISIVDNSIKRGMAAFQGKENAEAAVHFEEALRQDSASIEARAMLIRVLERLDRINDAVEHALELAGNPACDVKSMTIAAKALTKARQFQHAVQAWKAVAELRPDEASGLVEAARCEVKQKAYPGALACAEAALAREPLSTVALSIKVEALRRLGNMPAMAEALQQLVPIEPATALSNLPALIASGHLLEATTIVAMIRKAGMAVDTGDEAVYGELVRGLEEQAKTARDAGDEQAALGAWKALRTVDPENKPANSALRSLAAPFLAEARDLAAAEDLAGSVDVLRRGLEHDAGNVRIMRELAATLERAGEWAAAVDVWCTLADTAGVKTAEAVARAARCALRSNQVERGISLYQRLSDEERAEFEETIASSIRRLGKMMREDFDAGDYKNAEAKARAILLSDPVNEAAQRICSKLLSIHVKALRQLAEEDTEERLQMCRKILALDPDNSEALRTLGKMLLSNRDYAAAEDVYRRLTRIEPEDARHWVKLAVAYRGTRQYPESFAAASRAIELEPGNEQAASILARMNSQGLVPV